MSCKKDIYHKLVNVCHQSTENFRSVTISLTHTYTHTHWSTLISYSLYRVKTWEMFTQILQQSYNSCNIKGNELWCWVNWTNYQWLKTHFHQALQKEKLNYLLSHALKEWCCRIVVIWRGSQRACCQKVSGKQ